MKRSSHGFFWISKHICISNNPESKQEELIAENKSPDEKNAEIEEKIRGPPARNIHAYKLGMTPIIDRWSNWNQIQQSSHYYYYQSIDIILIYFQNTE